MSDEDPKMHRVPGLHGGDFVPLTLEEFQNAYCCSPPSSSSRSALLWQAGPAEALGQPFAVRRDEGRGPVRESDRVGDGHEALAGSRDEDRQGLAVGLGHQPGMGAGGDADPVGHLMGLGRALLQRGHTRADVGGVDGRAGGGVTVRIGVADDHGPEI